MSCSVTRLDHLFCTINWWLTPIQCFQVCEGRSRDGSGGDISRHLLTLMPKKYGGKKKCEGISKEREHAWRGKGTFQNRLHKSWAWQQISYTQSTCPDRRSNSMQYFCTRVLPTLQTLCDPPELFDWYLFVVIATVGHDSWLSTPWVSEE